MTIPKISIFGEHAVLVEWDCRIDPELHEELLVYDAYLLNNHADKIVETVVAYHSIAIYLKKEISPTAFIKGLNSIKVSPNLFEQKTNICWHIPVCYDLEYGWDLDEVMELAKLNISEIIALHTKPVYRIYFIGFLPGFIYLGGLDKRLGLPRKNTPRLSLPKGSVGIGGNQTGIYPLKSPGGWQIIGQTPIELFTPKNVKPSPFRPGDSVKFYTIDKTEYKTIERAQKESSYELQKTIIE